MNESIEHKKYKFKYELPRAHIPNVVLVGSTGSGKSTISRQLARLLGFGWIDMDQAIEKKAKMPISEIFEKHGEFGFRDLELEVLDSLKNILNHVIVTGAGAVEGEGQFAKLKKLGPIVWLATPVSEIVARFLMKPDELRRRPLLAPAVNIENNRERMDYLTKALSDMLARRLPYYEQADLVLMSHFATEETTAWGIKNLLVDWGQSSTSH